MLGQSRKIWGAGVHSIHTHSPHIHTQENTKQTESGPRQTARQTQTHTHTHAHARTHTHAHTFSHTNTHTHAHTHTQYPGLATLYSVSVSFTVDSESSGWSRVTKQTLTLC